LPTILRAAVSMVGSAYPKKIEASGIVTDPTY